MSSLPHRRRFSRLTAALIVTGVVACPSASVRAADPPAGDGSDIFTDDGTGTSRPKPGTGTGKPSTTKKPAASRPAPSKPVPVPSQSAQAAALELVRQVYAEAMAKKSPDDRSAAAKQMLQQSGQSKDNPAELYVLLTQARDLAAGAADVATALDAIRKLSASFEPIDAPAMTADAMFVAAKATTDAGKCAAIADALLGAAETALSGGSLDVATTAVTRAEAPAKKSQDAALAARVAARKKELSTLQSQFAGMSAARGRLAADPNDSAANLLVGRFLCLVAGDWENGLQHLAKGGDVLLRTAAELELKNDPAPDAVAAVGDAWYDAAAAQTLPALKAKASEHARAWYGKAASQLVGLKKVRVQKRFDELAPPPPAEAVAGTGTTGGKPGTPGATTPVRPGAANTDVAASTSDVGALKWVEGLVKSLPAGARPKTAADTGNLGVYFAAANGRFKVDAVMRVSSVQLSGGSYAYIYFEPIGPVEVGGVKYAVTLRISSENNQARQAALQLKAGSEVRVRGSLQEYTVTPGDGEQPLGISAYLEAVQFAPGKIRKPK